MAEELTDETLREAELELGVDFPHDFVELMREHQGQSVPNAVIDVGGYKESIGYLSFFGKTAGGETKNSIVNWARTFRERGYSAKLVPFARSGGAPHFALDYRENDVPVVSFLYPDPESPETGFWASEHVATSIAEMLSVLEQDGG